MRVTNSMMVATTKININGNKGNVDKLNRQMANQKKIVKPSDDPIVAIRALRLRSSLSTIDQYYERNIPDTESWMEVTETALVNIKDIVTKAYEQVVYGTTDELNQDNRLAIQKELKALQEQVYNEGNSDYAGRTVFTGYKTNHNLTFTDSEDAEKSNYNITEHLSYQNIESKKYYTNFNTDTTAAHLIDNTATVGDVPLPKEYEIKRMRLSYDSLEDANSTVSFKYEATLNSEKTDVTVGFGADGSLVLGDYTFTIDQTVNPIKVTPSPPVPSSLPAISRTENYECEYYMNASPNYYAVYALKEDGNRGEEIGQITLNTATTPNSLTLTMSDGFQVSFSTGDTAAAEEGTPPAQGIYETINNQGNNQMFFNYETGELLMSDSVAEQLESRRADVEMTYDKKGFKVGELRPENFFDCTNNTDSKHPIEYQNFDENGDWIVEGIYYNIANKQPMQINTEARDVFDANIYRDMDELIDVVTSVVDAQNAVDAIKEKLKSGVYAEDSDEYKKLSTWLDAANKQLDYTTQNMHDMFSGSITKFQEYLDKVSLAVTDAGSRGERVELTKNRMSVQQTTFEDLKSRNEDAELSELVIDYSAAQVSYQAALQAASRIGRMTLLDYL